MVRLELLVSIIGFLDLLDIVKQLLSKNANMVDLYKAII